MTLTPGRRLGAYEVLALLGSGGMGEVYKARDTRLDRTVAIKILRDTHLDLQARFAREAKAIAALAHPHICTLFDIGREQGMDYLVMECLEGETLAGRLKRGALPVDQALKTAIEIGDALNRAHHAGIVHRDLKPSNVMLTKAGAKLLDFGLAKFQTAPQGATATVAQTPISGDGALIGTVPYMAPEQLEGLEADARSDLFAFGAVLYEMVAGRRAFVGESQASVIAAILDINPPPLSTSRPLVPPALDRLVSKCLAKDPENRWQTTHDLVDELKWIAEVKSTTPDVLGAAPRRRWSSLPWLVATVAILAAVVISALALRRPTPELVITRLEVNTPPTADPTSFALSPDGRQLVFVATTDAKSMLWLRPLDQTDPRLLAGTERATFPFWAPDSRAVAFFADGKLKRLDLAGGAPQTLADAPDGAGGTWNRDGVILFAPSGAGSGLMRVAAAATGGTRTAATRLDGGAWNHLFPVFLPDGRRFVFFVRHRPDLQGVYLGSLDSPEAHRLMAADTAAVFAPPGTLLLVREGVLVAIPFDPALGTLTGDPTPVAQRVGSASYRGAFSVSETGLLAHRTGVETKRRKLLWIDRRTTVMSTLWSSDESRLLFSQLAPDGQRVAVGRTVNGNSDIWLIETARGVASRFTTDPAIEGGPVWSPDGSQIIFGSNRNGAYDLFEKPVSGGDETLVLSSSDNKAPTDWSRNGFLLYSSQNAKTGTAELSAIKLDGTRQPLAASHATHSEDGGQFSPDGRWIAYRSNESGRREIYVRPFPGPGESRVVSTGGGSQARWRRDGKELFFMEGAGTLMAAPIGLHNDGQTVTIGAPAPLFRTAGHGGGDGLDTPQYSVSSDGQRFLVNVDADDNASASPITIVQNWTAGLKK